MWRREEDGELDWGSKSSLHLGDALLLCDLSSPEYTDTMYSGSIDLVDIESALATAFGPSGQTHTAPVTK